MDNRKIVIEALLINYLQARENNNIRGLREDSANFLMGLGELKGACMALELDWEETDTYLTVFTQKRKKIIVKILKEDYV